MGLVIFAGGGRPLNILEGTSVGARSGQNLRVAVLEDWKTDEKMKGITVDIWIR